MQMLAWIPEWASALAIVALGLIVAACWRTRRARVATLCLFLLLLTGPLVGSSVREFRWFAGAGDRRGDVRVVFLNAQDPTAVDSRRLWTEIADLEPDVLLIANPGFIAPEWRRMDAPDAVFTSMKWLSPFLVAVRHGDVSLRTMSRRDEVRAIAIEFEPDSDPHVAEGGGGLRRIAVVDMPSDWARPRGVLMTRLLEAIAKYEARTSPGFDLVVGDFNTTPRSPSRRVLGAAYRDGFEMVGAGWGATWPRRWPMLRIDAVFVNQDRQVSIESVRTFDPGQGGHLGLVIDLAARQPSMLN